VILEPKKRLIAAAPFQDRVVQHALCNVVQPLLERSFIADTYACIKERGTHRAVDRYTHFARRHSHVLKMDIKRFFPSIDHAILFELLSRRLPEPPVRDLIRKLIDNGRGASEEVVQYFPGDGLFTPVERGHGLPIGNLTSQLWANVYLDGLDHFVTERLGRGAYLRYMDDFVVFGDDKTLLRGVMREVRDWLASARRLHLHETKSHVRRVTDGVTFLGYRIWPTHRRVRRENVVRARRRVRRLNDQFARGELSQSAVKASLMAWLGHTKHADARQLERCVLGKVSLRHGHPA
jgi:RNA-directed DNA polymerase